MPQENDKKPCTAEGCAGTMTFSKTARPPGWGAGSASEGGQVVWGAEEQPGWDCDQDREHFEPAES